MSNTTVKSFWQTDAFVVLALVVFWPIGLFLMWKYAAWRKWIKGVLTFFFILAALPILLVWGLLFGLKGYSFVNNIVNPRTINQSNLYVCNPVNSQWGKCTNTKYSFSFEYPASWSYIDLRPEGVGFAPTSEGIQDNFVISMGSPHEWDTEEAALRFAKGSFGISQRDEATIDGLFATKDYKAFTDDGIVANAVIVDDKMTYQFMSLPDKAGSTLTKAELQSIFDHMADSFDKE
jgi:hypothetical protein